MASRYRNTFVEFLLMPMVDSTARKEGRLCTETYLYDAYITASLYNSTFERISLNFDVGFSTNSLLYKARITHTKSSLPLVKYLVKLKLHIVSKLPNILKVRYSVFKMYRMSE